MDVFDAATALAREEQRLLLGALAATYATRIGLVLVRGSARGGGHGVVLRKVLVSGVVRDGIERGGLLLGGRHPWHCYVLQAQGLPRLAQHYYP